MAQLLDGSAGSSEQQRGEDSSQGSLRSAAAAEAEPSALASSSIGFPELVCFCWGGVWQEINELLLQCWLREAK